MTPTEEDVRAMVASMMREIDACVDPICDALMPFRILFAIESDKHARRAAVWQFVGRSVRRLEDRVVGKILAEMEKDETP